MKIAISSPDRSTRLVTYALLILTMIIWGGTFVAGKIAGLSAPPLTIALWRFILAALFLIPLALRSKEGLWPKQLNLINWLELIFISFTGLVIYNYCFIKGLTLTQAGRASVIVATNPVLIFLGSILFFSEKMTWASLFGLALSVTGTIIAVTSGRPWDILGPLNSGDLLILGCVLTWAIYSLIGKRVLTTQSPHNATTWATIIAVIMLWPITIMDGDSPSTFLRFSGNTWFCLTFLGLGGTALGFTFFYRGILVLGPHKAGIFINLVPIFGIICGWLLLGEEISFSLLVGLLLNMAGIRLIQKN